MDFVVAYQIFNRKGGFYELRKQFIPCKEKMRPVTGGCGGKAGCQQADDLKMGNRGDASRHPPVEADVAFVSRVAGRLIEFDMDVKEIQDIIDRTSEETEKKIDWTKAWGKKYPILVRYQKEVNIPNYAVRLGAMVDELKEEYHYSDLDAFLVLKDILAKVWQSRKK